MSDPNKGLDTESVNVEPSQNPSAARGGTPSQGVQPPSAETAALFRGLAQIVYAAEDFDEVYSSLCKAAPALITGCDHASLMLVSNGRFVTAAASDEIAERVDGFERELGEGPCVDAVSNEAAYVDPSLEEDARWPKLAARVVKETPVRGMAGFRLLVDDQKVGALNLFSDTPGSLTELSVNEGAVVGSFVSMALLAANRRHAASSLRRGLESNREIGKAVGLMMAFHKIDDQSALEVLRKASQDMNLKLAEVAREFVAHHNTRRA